MEKAANTSQRDTGTNDQPHKNFGLNQSDFTELVEDLRLGGENLFQRIFLAHFADCQLYLQRQHGLSQEQAYDLTMDTLLIFRRKLIAGKIAYGNMRFLFTRMAYQLFLKQVRREPTVQSIDGLPDFVEEAEQEAFPEEVREAFAHTWQSFGDGCKDLLRQFYYEQITLEEIAGLLQVKAASIRKRKQRCMEKLRTLFADNYHID